MFFLTRPTCYNRIVTVKEIMKNVLLILVAIIAISSIAYGSWKFERWWHYKLSYSSQVAEQIQPIVDRVTALEKRVLELENKK